MGCRVRIHSLEGAIEFNRKEAVCERWDPVKRRWHVRLDSGEVKALRPDNLEVLDKGTNQKTVDEDNTQVAASDPGEEEGPREKLLPPGPAAETQDDKDKDSTEVIQRDNNMGPASGTVEPSIQTREEPQRDMNQDS